MSMWQLRQVFDGYAKAHDPNAGKELSAAEADELWQWVQQGATKH